MEEPVKRIIDILSFGIEVIAVLIVGAAAFATVWKLAGALIHLPNRIKDRTRLRLEFGTWLVLALEFLLAADILRTAINPSWTEIGQLAAIVVTRTVLNHFLEMDMKRAEEEIHQESRPE